MDAIRLATPEEMESIKDFSDLSFATSVVTFGGKDFAVLRNCFEIDPMIFHEGTGNQRKLIFGMNLETALRLQGVREVYFNVKVRDEAFREILEKWGATPTSTEPEIRFKKVL